jgi:hypothetical protein
VANNNHASSQFSNPPGNYELVLKDIFEIFRVKFICALAILATIGTEEKRRIRRKGEEKRRRGET